MDREAAIEAAGIMGWAPTLKFLSPAAHKREIASSIPVFERNDCLMWAHPSGVTVANASGDGITKGLPASMKLTNHRYYGDLYEALEGEG